MQLNRHSLEVARFSHTGDDRPVLSALCVNKTHCVATNSHTLLEVAHPRQNDADTPQGVKNDGTTGLLPGEAALHASKNIPRGESLFAFQHAFTSVDPAKKRMTLTTTDLMQEKSVEAGMIDGTYPDYRQVFPTGRPKAVIAIDPKLLKEMADYFAKHEQAGRVLIEFHGDMQPLVLRGETDAGQAIRGAIMPMRQPARK